MEPSGSGVQSPIAQFPAATTMMLLGAIMVAAVVLRVLFLGAASFNLDEVHSVDLAHYNWPSFVSVVAGDQANMALYYLLLRIWRVIGENEATIRMLSVIPAIAVIPVIYAIGAHLFGTHAGLYSALLIAVNAYHVRFAQDARSYSLTVFLISLSSWFFIRGVEEHSTRHWVRYVAASILAVYSHFFAVLVLVAHGISLAFLPRRTVPWRPLLTSFAVIVCALLPLAAFAATRDRGQIAWIPRPQPTNIIGVFYVLAGGNGRLAEAGRFGKALFLEYFALCSIAAAAAIGDWVRSRTGFKVWRYALLLTWLIAPVVLAYTVSQFKPIFQAIYLVVCLPALMVLSGSGLTSLRRNVAFLMMAVLVVLAVHDVFAYYDSHRTQGLREATYRILETAMPGDAVVFYAPYTYDAFDYYRRRFPGPIPGITVLAPKGGIAPVVRRVWLFLSYDEQYRDEVNALQAYLDHRYASHAQWKFADVRLILYSGRHAKE